MTKAVFRTFACWLCLPPLAAVVFVVVILPLFDGADVAFASFADFFLWLFVNAFVTCVV